VRLFIAVNLPLSVREQLVQATTPLRAAAPELSWIDAERLHLTLKFIGDADEGAVDPLVRALDDLATRHRPFALDLKGVGAFPNFRRARVVWMGIEDQPRLELLQHDVEEHCATLGYEVEGRPFRPHLTLARVRATVPERTLRELARSARRVDHHTEVDVTSIDLMQSTLGARGSRYDMLHEAPLGAARAV
jgi:RNA 2',3'-cyclic 3'-phosphodiesterase